MCKVFKVSRSGYYKYLKAKPSKRSLENIIFKKEILEIYENSYKRYGSPKIAAKMRSNGFCISRPRVAKIMKAEGLKSIIRKKYVATTDSKHNFEIKENLLNRNFITDAPGKVWVSDITYIPVGKSWIYLTIVMDLFDKKIIGWSISSSLKAKDTVIKALQMAKKNRIIENNLIFHSDRGVQYACNEFTSLIRSLNIRQSMSRKGDCWDNAMAENFFKILKSELIYHNTFMTIPEAELELFRFIEIWYNRKRIHAALNYQTPDEYGKNKNIKKCA